jgi:hypothetical protein
MLHGGRSQKIACRGPVLVKLVDVLAFLSCKQRRDSCVRSLSLPASRRDRVIYIYFLKTSTIKSKDNMYPSVYEAL